jgi:hypothetical protein
LTNSEAYKKLKVDTRPEWTFKIFTKPAALVVEHYDEAHTISEKEMRDLLKGFLEKEYVWKGKMEEEVVEIPPVLTLERYKWLPKYLYPRFMRAVCEALGVPYSRAIVEALVYEAETPKAKVEFKEPTEWEKAEKRAKELSQRYERLWEEIEALEKFYKEVKLRRKE